MRITCLRVPLATLCWSERRITLGKLGTSYPINYHILGIP
jgi:hypothetical protein